MKRYVKIAALLLSLACVFSACAGREDTVVGINTRPESSGVPQKIEAAKPTASKEEKRELQTKLPETIPGNDEILTGEDDVIGVIEKNKLGMDEGEIDSIPLYTEKDLLYEPIHCFFIWEDYGYRPYNTRKQSSQMFGILPTTAIRESEDGSQVYTMYDAAEGFRIYAFFLKSMDYAVPAGYPVLMAKSLSYSDFAGLKKDMTLTDVEKIDPIIGHYRIRFNDRSDFLLNNMAKNNEYLPSVHLLKDGVLKIQYERRDGEYYIRDMEFSEDFVLKCLDGDISYRLAPEDYADNQ